MGEARLDSWPAHRAHRARLGGSAHIFRSRPRSPDRNRTTWGGIARSARSAARPRRRRRWRKALSLFRLTEDCAVSLAAGRRRRPRSLRRERRCLSRLHSTLKPRWWSAPAPAMPAISPAPGSRAATSAARGCPTRTSSRAPTSMPLSTGTRSPSDRVPFIRAEDYSHMLEGLRKAGWEDW